MSTPARTLFGAALVGGLLLSLMPGTAVSGDDDPAALVEYRHTVMESLGKHMKASGMILKGKVARKGDLFGHAHALHEFGKEMGSMFPESTKDLKSDSLPAVWEDRAGFDKAIETYLTETGKLVELAKKEDFDGFKLQFREVGKSCGGCHKTYRVDEDEH